MPLKNKFAAACMAIAITVIAINVFQFNRFFARFSVPLSAYTSVFPLLSVDEVFSNGRFLEFEIGMSRELFWDRARLRQGCKWLVDGRFVSMKEAVEAGDQDMLVLRCRRAGILWNERYSFEGQYLQKIDVGGGVLAA